MLKARSTIPPIHQTKQHDCCHHYDMPRGEAKTQFRREITVIALELRSISCPYQAWISDDPRVPAFRYYHRYLVKLSNIILDYISCIDVI